MGYFKQTWRKLLSTTPNKFTKTNETVSSVELTSDPGTISQYGTKYTVDRMSNIEDGIYSLNIPRHLGSVESSITVAESDSRGIAFDGVNLIRSDYTTGKIYIHDGLTSTISSEIDLGISISGMTYDGVNLIICSDVTNLIYVLDGVSGTILDSFTPPAGGNPTGLAFANGDLLSCNGSTNVYVHDGISSTIKTTLNSVSFGVPEGIEYDGKNLLVSIAGSTSQINVYNGVSTSFAYSFTLDDDASGLVYTGDNLIAVYSGLTNIDFIETKHIFQSRVQQLTPGIDLSDSLTTEVGTTSGWYRIAKLDFNSLTGKAEFTVINADGDSLSCEVGFTQSATSRDHNNTQLIIKDPIYSGTTPIVSGFRLVFGNGLTTSGCYLEAKISNPTTQDVKVSMDKNAGLGNAWELISIVASDGLAPDGVSNDTLVAGDEFQLQTPGITFAVEWVKLIKIDNDTLRITVSTRDVPNLDATSVSIVEPSSSMQVRDGTGALVELAGTSYTLSGLSVTKYGFQFVLTLTSAFSGINTGPLDLRVSGLAGKIVIS